METQANQPTIELKSQVIDLPHGDLLNALFFMWEAQQRCAMDFFLTRSTAKAAMTSHMLDGDTLDLGVRKLAWVSDNKDLLMIFLANEPIKIVEETPDILRLEYKGVKINLRIYEDNDCVRNLIPVHYEHEDFWLPNQFERFTKEFDNG